MYRADECLERNFTSVIVKSLKFYGEIVNSPRCKNSKGKFKVDGCLDSLIPCLHKFFKLNTTIF